MDSLLPCEYDVRESKWIGAWPDRRNSTPRIDGGDKEANMSDDTAREIAEREIGRAEDKRQTPERRAYRTGDGRRRKTAAKARKQAPEGAVHPIPPRPPSGRPADQRRFNRV
jgi:hypothetical protein